MDLAGCVLGQVRGGRAGVPEPGTCHPLHNARMSSRARSHAHTRSCWASFGSNPTHPIPQPHPRMCSRPSPRRRAGSPRTPCCGWRVGGRQAQALQVVWPKLALVSAFAFFFFFLSLSNQPQSKLPACPARPKRAGFNDPWERLLFKGRELKAGASLAEQGVGEGAVLTAVRRVLIADGWKVGCTAAVGTWPSARCCCWHCSCRCPCCWAAAAAAAASPVLFKPGGHGWDQPAQPPAAEGTSAPCSALWLWHSFAGRERASCRHS